MVLPASAAWAQGPGAVESAALAVIEKKCLTCHNADAKTSRLELTSLDAAPAGGAQGGRQRSPRRSC